MSIHRVDALVVTLQNGRETVALLNAQGEEAKLMIQSKIGCFGWVPENLFEMSYLLVYGLATISAVRVDGKVWPRLTVRGFTSLSVGWQVDLAGNHLVICLLGRQIEQSELTTKSEVKSSPAGKKRMRLNMQRARAD